MENISPDSKRIDVVAGEKHYPLVELTTSEKEVLVERRMVAREEFNQLGEFGPDILKYDPNEDVSPYNIDLRILDLYDAIDETFIGINKHTCDHSTIQVCGAEYNDDDNIMYTCRYCEKYFHSSEDVLPPNVKIIDLAADDV